jgi:hypothetical protein
MHAKGEEMEEKPERKKICFVLLLLSDSPCSLIQLSLDEQCEQHYCPW